jgi:hypothetical protein
MGRHTQANGSEVVRQKLGDVGGLVVWSLELAVIGRSVGGGGGPCLASQLRYCGLDSNDDHGHFSILNSVCVV